MALVKRRMSRRKLTILAGVFGVIFIAGLWYLFGTGDTGISGGPSEDPATLKLKNDLRELQNVEQHLRPSLEELLQDARFQELRQFGEVPVTPGVTGRPNPFQPL